MKEYKVNVYVPWKISGCYIVDVDVEANDEKEALQKAKKEVGDMTQGELIEDCKSCGGCDDLDDPEFLNSEPDFNPECYIEGEFDEDQDDEDDAGRTCPPPSIGESTMCERKLTHAPTSQQEAQTDAQEIAIAIDRKMQIGESPHNPFICAVPTGLTAQQALECVCKQFIEESLEDDPDEGIAPPEYDYLWYGKIEADRLIGSECTEEYGTIQPIDHSKYEAMVAAARKMLKARER